MRKEVDWVQHTFKDFDLANEYKWVKEKNCYQMKLHSDLQLSSMMETEPQRLRPARGRADASVSTIKA